MRERISSARSPCVVPMRTHPFEARRTDAYTGPPQSRCLPARLGEVVVGQSTLRELELVPRRLRAVRVPCVDDECDVHVGRDAPVLLLATVVLAPDAVAQ